MMFGQHTAAAWIGAAALAASGVVAWSARRSGRSLRGELVSRLVLPMMNRAGKSASQDGGTRMLAADRAAGPAEPPLRIRRRLDVTRTTMAGAPVFVVVRRGLSTGRRLLYLHGGAFVLDLLPDHWPILAGLAERLDASLVVPLYPLAPEHDFAPAHAMIDALHAHLVAEVGRENVALVGDSAGGGLALTMCQRWRDADRTQPACAALLSPWADLTVSDPAQTVLAKRDPILSLDRLRACGFAWAGPCKSNDPRVSPLFASLHDLPPLLVMTGTDDILNSDAHRLDTSARASGASLSLREYRGMFHVWMAAPIPEAERALDEVAAFCDAHLRAR